MIACQGFAFWTNLFTLHRGLICYGWDSFRYLKMCSSESLTFCHPESPRSICWVFTWSFGMARIYIVLTWPALVGCWQFFLDDNWLLKHGLCNNTHISVSLLSLTCGFLICFYTHTVILLFGKPSFNQIWSLNAGFYWSTLPKFVNLRIMVSKRSLLFQGAIFRWTMLNFGEGTWKIIPLSFSGW